MASQPIDLLRDDPMEEEGIGAAEPMEPDMLIPMDENENPDAAEAERQAAAAAEAAARAEAEREAGEAAKAEAERRAAEEAAAAQAAAADAPAAAEKAAAEVAANACAWVPTVGARVKARYCASQLGPAGTRWYNGYVTAVHGDGTFGVEYDDGDSEGNVQCRYMKKSDAPPPLPPPPLPPPPPPQPASTTVAKHEDVERPGPDDDSADVIAREPMSKARKEPAKRRACSGVPQSKKPRVGQGRRVTTKPTKATCAVEGRSVDPASGLAEERAQTSPLVSRCVLADVAGGTEERPIPLHTVEQAHAPPPTASPDAEVDCEVGASCAALESIGRFTYAPRNLNRTIVTVEARCSRRCCSARHREACSPNGRSPSTSGHATASRTTCCTTAGSGRCS